MKNLRRKKDGGYDAKAGAEITATIAEAIALSARRKRRITFEFNGVTATVRSDSNPKLIYRDWCERSRLLRQGLSDRPN